MGVNVRKSALSISGEADVGWYASSKEVQRGFAALRCSDDQSLRDTNGLVCRQRCLISHCSRESASTLSLLIMVITTRSPMGCLNTRATEAVAA